MPLMGVWFWRCPPVFCHEQTLPTGPEVQGPHFQPTPSQLCSEASIGTGAEFTRVQPSGAKSCALVTPVKDALDVESDSGGKWHSVVPREMWQNRAQGLSFKTSASQLHSVQKTGPFLARSRCYDGLRRVTAFPRGFVWDLHQAGGPSM